jgi:hypothetical protein
MSIKLTEGLWEKIYFELLRNIQIISNRDERGDGTNKIFRTYKFQLTKKTQEEADKSISKDVMDYLKDPTKPIPTIVYDNTKYENSFGEMSNGMLVDMSKVMKNVQDQFEDGDYKEVEGYNFLSSMKLNHNSIPIRTTSEFLLNKGKEAIACYVNGRKIPFRYTYLYSNGSNTNVIIPRSYIDKLLKENSTTMIFDETTGKLSRKVNNKLVPYEFTIYFEEKKFKDQTKYISSFEFWNGTNEKVLTLKDSFENIVNPDGTNVFVFINGYYQVPGSLNDSGEIVNGDFIIADNGNNSAKILFKTTPTSGSEVEIFIDGSVQNSGIMSYSLENVAVGNTIPFFLQDTFYKPVFGPVDKDSCSFFVNGLRINNKYITQVGRLDFHTIYKNEVHDMLNFDVTTNISQIIPTILYQDEGNVNKRKGGADPDINMRQWTTSDERPVYDYEYQRIYGDDYFMYNFMGNRNEFPEICRALIGDNSNTYNTYRSGILRFNDYFGIDKNVPTNYLDILSKPFNDTDLTWLFKEIVPNKLTYKEKIKQILSRFPYLMKNFLEYFAVQETSQIFCWNGTDTSIRMQLPITEHQIGERIVRVIYVNNKITDIQTITYSSNPTDYILTIDINPEFWLLSTPPNCNNLVTVFEISDSFKDLDIFKKVSIDRRITDKGKWEYRVDTDTFGNIVFPSDFELLAITFKESDSDGYYFGDNTIGWKKLDKSKYDVKVENGIITVQFGDKDPLIHTLLIVRNRLLITDFLEKYSIPFTNIESFEDIFKEIWVGTVNVNWNNEFHDVKVPLIHTGKIVIYDRQTGRELYPEVDYSFRNPVNQPTLRQSIIALFSYFGEDMTNRISVNLLPSFNGGESNQIMVADDTFDADGTERSIFNWKTWYEDTNSPKLYNSGIEPYKSRGLIYLSKLPFPYSPKYTNIHLNGVKVDDKDVAILSNKLVRVAKQYKTSFQNLFIDYNFAVHYDNLKEFIDLYSDSYFEKSVAEMFDGFDFFNNSTKKTTKETGLEHFLSFDPFMEKRRSEEYFLTYFNKQPNLKRFDDGTDNNKNDVNILTELYVRWFLSNDSDHIFSATQKIPERINSLLDLFRPNGASRDVVINPAIKNLSQDYPFATTKTQLQPDGSLPRILINNSKGEYIGCYYYTSLKYFLQFCINHNLPPQQAYEEYSNYNESNFLFKRDLKPIKAIVPLNPNEVQDEGVYIVGGGYDTEIQLLS